MQLGMIGLGRMGGNMVRRLLRGGHDCVVYDANPAHVKSLADAGARPAASLPDLVAMLPASRAVWVMLPAGDVTGRTIHELHDLLAQNDIIIDGGNSHYKDDIRRANQLSTAGIHLVDVGTSGGVWGLERGYCLMIGGPREVVQRLEPLFRTLAPGQGGILPTPGSTGTASEGFLYCGPSGAGHFVKMVHNGIEYGLMQAYAEGFDLLHGMQNEAVLAEERYQFDLGAVAELWRRGSVVSSWLLDLIAKSLAERPQLEGFTGNVQDSGEGRWTVQAAVEAAVPIPNLAGALFTRFRSRQDHTFGEKLLSAMRFQFGGHVEPGKQS
jgi:6-phosphogluconate dehydrogenase